MAGWLWQHRWYHRDVCFPGKRRTGVQTGVFNLYRLQLLERCGVLFVRRGCSGAESGEG